MRGGAVARGGGGGAWPAARVSAGRGRAGATAGARGAAGAGGGAGIFLFFFLGANIWAVYLGPARAGPHLAPTPTGGCRAGKEAAVSLRAED